MEREPKRRQGKKKRERIEEGGQKKKKIKKEKQGGTGMHGLHRFQSGKSIHQASRSHGRRLLEASQDEKSKKKKKSGI